MQTSELEIESVSKMSLEENLDKELIYTMQLTRRILRIIGIWPLTNRSSRTERIVKIILNCVCFFLFIITIVPGLLQIFKREKNLQLRLNLCAPLLNFSLSFLQYIILLFRAQDILKGVQQMSEDWRNVSNEDRNILMNKAHVGRKLVKVAAMLMYGSGLCYRTIIPLSKVFLSKGNSTVRPLPCPSYFVKFNEQETPAYEIIFTLQLLAGVVVYSVRCGLCGLSAFFVMHVCGQLGIVMDRLNTLADKEDIEDIVVDKRISVIVRLQVKTWAFLKHVEQIVEYVCIIEMLIGTLVICFVGYYILESEKDNFGAMLGYATVLTSFVFSTFIFCYIGQRLDDESTDVGLASCTIDWYRIPVRKARCLLLIIAMSNIPMKLTAGKMMDLCLSTFATIMKTSVAYLNILRTVT